MKTKIKNDEWKVFGDGSFGIKMRAEGKRFILHFSQSIQDHDENKIVFICNVKDDWGCEVDTYEDTSLFGLFNKLCEKFKCTIVKFQETLPIVDNAMKGIYPEKSEETEEQSE